MSQARDWKLALSCAFWLLVGGCASSGLSPLNFGVRQVPGADRAAVFDATRTTLADLGYRIDRSDLAEGVVTTYPLQAKSRDEPSRPGFRLRQRSRVRRVAQVRLAESAEAVSVYCKVVIQEQTTEAHRMFAGDRMSSDTPGRTPIDDEAATTTEQNDAWQTIRRDKAAESRILEAILQQTGSRP